MDRRRGECGGTKLYVTGIDVKCQKDDLLDIFLAVQPSAIITSVFIKIQPPSSSHTYGFVDYENRRDAMQAIQALHKTGPHYLGVKLARRQENNSQCVATGNSFSQHDRYMPNYSRGYGRGQLVDSSEVSLPIGRGFVRGSTRGAACSTARGSAAQGSSRGSARGALYRTLSSSSSTDSISIQGNFCVPLVPQMGATIGKLYPPMSKQGRSHPLTSSNGQKIFEDYMLQQGVFADRPVGGPPAGISVADFNGETFEPIKVIRRGRGRAAQFADSLLEDIPAFDDRISVIVRSDTTHSDKPALSAEEREKTIEAALDALFPTTSNDTDYEPTYASLESPRPLIKTHDVYKLHIAPVPDGLNKEDFQEMLYGKAPIGCPGICVFVQPAVEDKPAWAFVECFSLKDAEDTIDEYDNKPPYFFRVRHAYTKDKPLPRKSLRARGLGRSLSDNISKQPRPSRARGKGRRGTLRGRRETRGGSGDRNQQQPNEYPVADESSSDQEILKDNLTYLSVHFLHQESPSVLFMAVKDRMSDMQRLTSEMSAFYQAQESDPDQRLVVAGDLCAVHDRKSNQWHRGVVCSGVVGNELKVTMKDAGHTLKVMCDDIRPLDKRFTKEPYNVIRCHLAGLRPTGSSKCWSQRALDYLEDLSSKHRHDCQYITQQGPIVNCSVPIVLRIAHQPERVDPSLGGWTNVNQAMVEREMACLANEQASIAETEINLDEIQLINNECTGWGRSLSFKHTSS